MSWKTDELKKLGCDLEGAMERFLDDEDFYFECYNEVILDPCFEQLGEALEQHNVKAAFDYSHNLKGVTANLGLTSLVNQLVEIVEPLRNGSDEGMLPLYQDLMVEREKYKTLL